MRCNNTCNAGGRKRRRGRRTKGHHSVQNLRSGVVEQKRPDIGYLVKRGGLRIKSLEVAVVQVPGIAQNLQRSHGTLHLPINDQGGGPHRLMKPAQRSLPLPLHDFVQCNAGSQNDGNHHGRRHQKNLGPNAHGKILTHGSRARSHAHIVRVALASIPSAAWSKPPDSRPKSASAPA